MGGIADEANVVYRDYIMDGSQASGLHEPSKNDIRGLFKTIDVGVAAAQAGLTIVANLADRDAFFADADNQSKLVYVNNNNGAADDPDNGVYEYVDGAPRIATAFIQGAALAVQPLVDAAANSATAAENARDQVLEATTAIDSNVYGAATIDTNGTPLGARATVFYRPKTLKAYDQLLTLSERALSAAGVVKTIIAKVEDDGSLSLAAQPVEDKFDVGIQEQPQSIVVPAGCIVGEQYTTAGLYYTAGAIDENDAVWTTPFVPGDHTAKTVAATNAPVSRFTLEGDVAGKARSGFDLATTTAATVGVVQGGGWPDLVDTGTDTPAGCVIIDQNPAPAAGVFTSVKIGAAGAGTSTAMVVEVDPDTLAVTIVDTKPIGILAGVDEYPVNIPIAAGQYRAIVGGGYKYQANANPLGIPMWTKAGGLANGDVVVSSFSHRYEVAFTTKTGILAQLGVALASGAYQTLLPNDTRLLVSDFDTIAERSATTLRFIRSIVDANNYQHCSPGSRVGFYTTSRTLTIAVYWNDLVTRDTSENAVGCILIDGAVAETFASSVAADSEGPQTVSFDLGDDATKKVEIVWPYGVGMELRQIKLDLGAAVDIAPDRPTAAFMPVGDSTTHGFAASSIDKTWVFGVAVDRGEILISEGFGSHQATPADGALLGAVAAPYGANVTVLYNMGINDCVAGKTPAEFQSQVEGWVDGFVAAAPDAVLALSSAFYCPAHETGHAYDLDAYRDAMEAAATAKGLPYINGKALITNSDDRFAGDLTHPNDLGSAELRANIGAAL